MVHTVSRQLDVRSRSSTTSLLCVACKKNTDQIFLTIAVLHLAKLLLVSSWIHGAAASELGFRIDSAGQYYIAKRYCPAAADEAEADGKR